MCDKNKLINNTSMKSMNQYLRDWKNTYENIRNEESKLYKYLCNGFPIENNVIFFDDSIEHISAVHKNCKKTTAVYLPFERPFLFKSMKNKDLNQYKNSMNSDNSYIKSSNSKMTVTSSGITNEMIYLNGYTKLPSYMQRLYDWVFQTNELKNRIVIFDWDYTLNVNNGFHIFDEKNYTKSDYNKMLTDTLIYLFGGEQRFKSIKEMMKHLLNNNVKVYIVTCNGNASTQEGKNKFVRLLQHLFDYEYIQNKHLVFVNPELELKDKAINRIIRNEKQKKFFPNKTIKKSTRHKQKSKKIFLKTKKK
jgi:hypothetical protein